MSEQMRATHVVVDTRDGYTFWATADGTLFDETYAVSFAYRWNDEIGPECSRFQVFALTDPEAHECFGTVEADDECEDPMFGICDRCEQEIKL